MPKSDRDFDKTHLSIDQAEARGFIHRDYIAHCLRWSHVAKSVMRSDYKNNRYLDIGCGKDQPLARLLYTNKLAPTGGYFIGADLNKITLSDVFKSSAWKPMILGEVDAVSNVSITDGLLSIEGTIIKDVAPPTHVVCFEVIEHMKPKYAKLLVQKFAELAKAGATIYTSTPCYSEKVGAAGNHINEMTYEVLGSMFEANNLEIVDHWGTFAGQTDYKPELTPAEKDIFDKLSLYYDSNLVSNIMAPLFPGKSRNCLWVLKYNESFEKKFPGLDNCAEPWSSSKEYLELR